MEDEFFFCKPLEKTFDSSKVVLLSISGKRITIAIFEIVKVFLVMLNNSFTDLVAFFNLMLFTPRNKTIQPTPFRFDGVERIVKNL
jgi:hypothetical protein